MPYLPGLSGEVPAVAAQSPRIFISWGAPDRSLARSLANRLKGVGLRVFFSEQDMELGDGPFEAVPEEIHRSRVAIFALSAESLARPWVIREIECCFYESKLRTPPNVAVDPAKGPPLTMIPVVVGAFDAANPPESFKNLPEPIRNLHRHTVTNPATHEDDVEALMRGVCRAIGDKEPLVIPAALFAMNEEEFGTFCQGNDAIDHLVALCHAAGINGASDGPAWILKTFGHRYKPAREDYAPFGQTSLRATVDDAVAKVNAMRRSNSMKPIWLKWDTEDLLSGKVMGDFDLQQVRSSVSTLTIVDSVSARWPAIAKALGGLPVPSDLRRLGIVWIPPFFQQSDTVEQLIWPLVMGSGPLTKAFTDWKDATERAVAFETISASPFRQWLFRSLADLARDPDPQPARRIVMQQAHPSSFGSSDLMAPPS